MKKIILSLLVLAAMASCQSNQRRADEVRTDTIAPVTRSAVSNTAQTYIYEGVIPAADGPGIRYHLTVNNQRNNDNATYTLRTTYLEAANGRDQTFTNRGNIQKLRGSATDANAVVYKLTADDGSDIMYFMEVENNRLRLLNDRLEDPTVNTNLNYDIVLIN